MKTCPDCNGDGKETCNNPDHGFIMAVPGEFARLGCPICGSDPGHKVPNGGKCDTCNGTGIWDERDCTCGAEDGTNNGFGTCGCEVHDRNRPMNMDVAGDE